MNLADRGYLLIVLTAVLAMVGIWSSDPAFDGLWHFPAALLLLGLALESYFAQRSALHVDVETHSPAFLGREQQAAFVVRNESPRPVTLEYAPVTPEGVEPLRQTRCLDAPARGTARDAFALVPVRLGKQRWPRVPARVRGRFGLAWWSRELHPACEFTIAPETLRARRSRARGNPSGMRPRRTTGAGSELHQLRPYVSGDPLSRIDWKATARTRELVTREFSEDQHLDILLAIDAGRFSRIRAGRLERLGLYANIAARFAEIATPNDDRIGLVVYSSRPIVVSAPGRGLPAVTRIRRLLEPLGAQQAESDPLAAAVRIRSLLRHRSLVVILTDLDDPTAAGPLARAVKLLSPPHLVVVAGVRSGEITGLARREARNWRDPWIALAAQEHESRIRAHATLLRRLGAPVVAAREDQLEQAVLAEYENLRRLRRV